MPPTDNNNQEPQFSIGGALRHILERQVAQRASGVDLIKKYCKLLLNYGVKQVTFEYDGSGDSGDMNYACVAIMPSHEEIDECLANVSSVTEHTAQNAARDRIMSWDDFVAARKKEKKPTVTPKMCDEICDAAFDLLPGGWEINDGSYGTVTINTANETIDVEHNERYTEVRTENFTF